MTADPAARELRERRRLLVAALAATRLADAPGAGSAPADCRRWLDRWAGVGLVAAGMARQGFDLELTRFGDEGWRATFSPAGHAHSVVSGTAWQATPWRAIQHAAWEALRQEQAQPQERRANEFRQSTSAPHVYAAGDITGTHQHTPAAWHEGQLAAENALQGNRRAVDFTVFPTATFTIPALAQVGLTEEAARRGGSRVAIGRAPFTDSSAAGVRGETEGLVKAVVDEATGRLLGVHVLGQGAEDLIHVAAVAMRGGLTRDDLAGMHYVFPTLAGSVFDAMYS